MSLRIHPRLLTRSSNPFFALVNTRHASLLSPSVALAIPPLSQPEKQQQSRSYRPSPPYRVKGNISPKILLKKFRLKPSEQVFHFLRERGFTIQGAEALQNAVWLWASSSRGVHYAFDCLSDLEEWCNDRSSVPRQYQRNWVSDQTMMTAWEHSFEDIGSHPSKTMGEALYAIGTALLTAHQVVSDEASVEACFGVGCYCLRLAVLFKNKDAAIHLLTFARDPQFATRVTDVGVKLETREAEALVRQLVTSRPGEHDGKTLLTFLVDEFSPRKINTQKPAQLQWGLERLSKMSRGMDTYNIIEVRYPFQNFLHPAVLKLRIIDHCIMKGITLDKYPLDELPELRNDVLIELVGVNDPNASMVMACQEDGPPHFSKEWAHLITVAAAGEIHIAIWMLGVHHLQKEGLLPPDPDTKNKLEGSLGLEFLEIAILAARGNGQAVIAYTQGLAAFCRSVGDEPRGWAVMKQTEADAKLDPNFDRRLLSRLQKNMDDYADGLWDSTGQKESLVADWFDLNSRGIEASVSMYRNAGASP